MLESGGPQRPGKIMGFCSKCNEKPLKGFKQGTGKWFTCVEDRPGCYVVGGHTEGGMKEETAGKGCHGLGEKRGRSRVGRQRWREEVE